MGEVVVVSTGLSAPTRRLCEASVRAQKGGPYRHVYIEAAEQSPRLTVTENQRGAILGLDPDDIVVLLDGDDWFPHDHVLQDVAALHASGVWLSYGQYMTSDGAPGHCQAYVHNNYRREPWYASHLKTFRAGLYQRIRKESLMGPDGDWIKNAHDVAAMIPMLEMAGAERVRFVKEVRYIYNISNSLQVTRPEEVTLERAAEQYVKSQPAYLPFEGQ